MISNEGLIASLGLGEKLTGRNNQCPTEFTVEFDIGFTF